MAKTIGQADAQGNNLKAVGVPVTGLAAFAPLETAVPTPEEGKNTQLKLNEAFKKLGLITEDGGFEYATETDGDPLVFYQDGYSIPTGVGKATCVLTLAQTDTLTQEFIRGRQFDEHGHMVVDAGGNASQFIFYTEEVFKNGVIRRRLCENASVLEAKETKSKRGEVTGYEVTVSLGVAAGHSTGNFHEWLIFPEQA